MTLRVMPLGLLAVGTATVLMAGCSGTDPIKAEADLATGGMSTANDLQVTAALAGVGAAVKGWEIENGQLPSAAEFATIPGAAHSGGAAVTYLATGTGFCLTATSSGLPTVVRVWTEPGGLQPVGTTC